VPIVAAHHEFSRNAAEGAREQGGLKLGAERTYSRRRRNLLLSRPHLVVVCSYSPDSVGVVRPVSELDLQTKNDRRGHGRAAVHAHQGAQPVAQMVSSTTILAVGAKGAISRRGRSHFALPSEGGGRKSRPVRILLASLGYAQLQVLQQAVEAIKTLDDAKLADYPREQLFTTVVGDVNFGAKGEWAQTRILQVQFQNTKGSDIAQFKKMTQVVVTPAEYASGEIIYPYERVK